MTSYIAAFACITLVLARVGAHLQSLIPPNTCEGYEAVDANGNCLYTGCKGLTAGGQCFYCGKNCSNGCGPAGYGAIVPDHLFGDFSSACCRHDMCIRSVFGRDKCNEQFREDMYAVCAKKGYVKRSICKLAASAYYRANKALFSHRYNSSQKKRREYELTAKCHGSILSPPKSCGGYQAVDSNGNCLYTGCKGPAAGGQCFYCGNNCSNGCGPAGYGAIVPDTLIGDFTSACCRHDLCFRSVIRMDTCNEQFREDMYAVCDKMGSVGKTACKLAASTYYQAVKAHGAESYIEDQEMRKAYEQTATCYGSTT